MLLVFTVSEYIVKSSRGSEDIKILKIEAGKACKYLNTPRSHKINFRQMQKKTVEACAAAEKQA